jgi:Tfp pilus assembly protein PilF
MLKSFMVIALLLSMLLVSGCSNGKPPIDMAQSHYKMAQSQMASKDYTGALNEMLQAVKIKPNSPDYEATLAMVYYEKKAYDLAEQHYKKALQLRPDDPNVQNNMAALYLDMQRWDDSARLFRTVADNLLFRYKTQALIGLGVAQAHGGNNMQAVLSFNEALDSSPNNTRALFLLAQTYYAMGKFSLARQKFEQVLKLVPDNNDVRIQLGKSCMQMGDKEAAAAAFREVANREDSSDLGAKAREYLQVVTQ